MKTIVLTLLVAALCIVGDAWMPTGPVQYTCLQRTQTSSSSSEGTDSLCRTTDNCTKTTVKMGAGEMTIWGCNSCAVMRNWMGDMEMECKECEQRMDLCNRDIV